MVGHLFIESVLLGKVDRINNYYRSNHDHEVIINLSWGPEEQCDMMPCLLLRLI